MSAITTAVLHPDPQRFPPGTNVSAYRGSAWSGHDRSVAPTGAADAGPVAVAADGSLTFTGLTDQTTYFAWAAGAGAPVRFATRHDFADDLAQGNIDALLLSDGSYKQVSGTSQYVGTVDPTTLGVVPKDGDVWIGGTNATVVPQVVATGFNVAFQTDGNIPVSKPAGAAVGDWLYVGVITQNGTITAPAGFTLVGSRTDGTADVSVYRRKIDGSEGVSFAFTMAEASQQSVRLAALVRGATSDLPNVGSANGAASASLAATIAAPLPDSLLLGFEGSTGVSSRTAVQPNGWAMLQDKVAASNFRQGALASYVAANTQPSSPSWSLSASGGDYSLVVLALAPAVMPAYSAPARVWTGGLWQ